MKNKYVGLLIVGISLLMGMIIYLFNNAMTEIVNENCSHGPTCPMWKTITLQTNISIIIMIFVIIIGLYMIFFAKDELLVHKEIHKVKIVKESSKGFDAKNYSSLIKSSSPEEQQILSVLVESKGQSYQSDLVIKTGLTKVQITRILDRLEGKGIIERRRRGMTNVVLLK